MTQSSLWADLWQEAVEEALGMRALTLWNKVYNMKNRRVMIQMHEGAVFNDRLEILLPYLISGFSNKGRSEF